MYPKYASDPINTLLNYDYSILTGEISKFIHGFGLDPYFAFYHKTHTGFEPLVYDLMESFRRLVESAVYKIANSKSTLHRIKQRDYAHTKKETIVLDSNLATRFMELLERNFRQERKYPFRYGAKTKDGLKMCQEITIAKITVQNLRDYCTQEIIFKI